MSVLAPPPFDLPTPSGSADIATWLSNLDSMQVSRLGVFHVLLVEDDPAQQKSLMTLFGVANQMNQGNAIFHVDVASTAAEAVSRLKDANAPRFHLVLLDMHLPDRNGYDLLPEIRELVDEESAIVAISVHTPVRRDPRTQTRQAESASTAAFPL